MPRKRSPKSPEQPVERKAEQGVPSPAAGPHPPSPTQPVFTLQGAGESLERTSCLHAKNVNITVKADFLPKRVRGELPPKPVEVTHNDLIEIEFENGERLWLRAAEYHEQFGQSAARDAAGTQVLPVPTQLDLLPAGMQARGPISWAIKALKVLGVDLAGQSAKGLAALVETRIPDDPQGRKKRPGPGLYRCAMASDGFDLTPVTFDDASLETPYLLFLHGTASSTWGSFGDLWSLERKPEFDALRKVYGERVLAFEHASLTQSPIENALELADKLPARIKLHVISHSRGGLVGELLCRAAVRETVKTPGKPEEIGEIAQPFQAEELRLFSDDAKGNQSNRQIKILQQLDAKLKSKQFQVERFVRVACPALGTTLASGRLDRWLSVVGTLAGRALPGTPLFDMFEDIGDFVAAVIKEHTNPDTLPGLEAMMPDSAFIKLVNWPRVTVPGDLAVIAGDIEPDAWWARLLVWVSDRFYEGDHDLVVNTPSMFGGVERSGEARVSFHKGEDVNHFRYFKNQGSAQRIVQALTATGEDWQLFEPLRKPTVEIARAVLPSSSEPRPVVFVVPGIMGSELNVGDEFVWLDIPLLTFGKFERLHINARGIRATQPFPRVYGDLCRYLAKTYKVVPFPYDWRLLVETEADRLAEAVRHEFDQAQRHNKPVCILAHSMGGLVVRTMIARHQKLWREVCSVLGARLLMLGTPNGGSHAITELLVGQSATLRQLAVLDLRHSAEQLLGIITRFPGVLAMLPKDNREDYFATQTWQLYHGQAGKGWVLPSEEDLTKASQFRQALDNSPFDPEHMIYVAGSADVTLAEMSLDTAETEPNKRIKFRATTRGDGRVTWDSGIPPGVPTWYMDVQHGDLPAHEEAFPALAELLDQGKTMLLPQTAPVSRATAALFPKPPETEQLYPNAEVFAATVVGGGSRRRHSAVQRALPVQVQVMHGNLAFATYPVAVGHYAGDSIVSAERQLDSALANALSRRHQLGIYPGAVETSAVFINPKVASNPSATPQGAIIVGLGTVGSLSAALLARCFTRALLEYVSKWSEYQPQDEIDEPVRGPKNLGISALLIGVGDGGITVADSAFALLRGVIRANKALANAHNRYQINKIEFIELFEDRAVQAVKALRILQSQVSAADAFAFDGLLHSSGGGRRSLAFEDMGHWWQRLQILGGGREGEPGDGTLRFSASTQRARSEVQLLPTQTALVNQFVKESIRTTQDNRAAARTLFELLLPNELKEQAPDQDNLVLILDEEAARYPWELLEDPKNLDRKPLVVEHGLLRQLESTRFRETVHGVSDNTALVIGDPVSKFPELKGAQDEACAVAQTLQSERGFQVEQRIRPITEQVVNALFERAYRVLHLAGHGVYQYTPNEDKEQQPCGQQLLAGNAGKDGKSPQQLTGMIIGDDMVLSPREVKQMRSVPELVFINCCYLGYIGPNAAQNLTALNLRNDYNLIAANVATEFIEMGVRAVIAAGWAVDDEAAKTFALTFYREMLRGEPFGKAVLEARKVTFERHQRTNTWGAYQCYGDPDYRLIHTGIESQDRPEDPDFVSPYEAIVKLNNLTSRLAIMAGEDIRKELHSLDSMVKNIQTKKWLDSGRVCAALGQAFGEAKRFEQAIDYYRLALTAEDSGVTLKDIEQLANLETRHAVRCWEAGDEPEAVLKQLDGGILRLESLFKSTGLGEPADKSAVCIVAGKTVERLSLLGSAYKRRAWISEPDRSESLLKMAQNYREAFELGKQKGKFDPYPLLNWLTGVLAQDWQKGAQGPKARERVPEFSDLLARASSELTAALATRRKFWTAVMQVDAQLIEALFEDRLDATVDSIAENYMESRKLGSPREFESTLDQIDFLLRMAQSDWAPAKALTSLRRKLD